MSGRVIVVGSINVDLVVAVGRFPAAGETVGGGTFAQHDGGKGANQAVAARRLSATVEFVGAVGSDLFGVAAAAALGDEGVGTRELRRVETRATGVAVILVDGGGENVIAVAPGANAAVTPSVVEESLARLALTPDDVVLVSHEIPTVAARTALDAARRVGAVSIFNPAPAAGLDRGIFGLADILTPNRSELATLATDEAARIGRPAVAGQSSERQARSLLETNAEGRGPMRAVVVTLGASGALVVQRAGEAFTTVEIPAVPVQVVDSTGAGDAFNGAVAAGLAAGMTVESSVRRAVVAASLATTMAGAREGMPTAAALDAAMNR